MFLGLKSFHDFKKLCEEDDVFFVFVIFIIKQKKNLCYSVKISSNYFEYSFLKVEFNKFVSL